MSFKDSKIQLHLLAVFCTLLTVFSFAYIILAKPESLRVSRDGVPFFTPKVINPDDGKSISVDELIQHFKNDNS